MTFARNGSSVIDRVLAICMTSGEPSLHASLASAVQQTGVQMSVIILGGFEEQDAHKRLYKTIWSERKNFDYFLKLDADMQIVNSNVVRACCHTMNQFPVLQGMSIYVQDFVTDASIEGMHIWRTGVRWLRRPPRLWTEMGRSTLVRRLVIDPTDEPLVLHAYNQGPQLVARSVLRRTLKAAADGVVREDNWIALRRILERAARSDSVERVAAGLAVEAALREPSKALGIAEGSLPLALVDQLLSWQDEKNALSEAISVVTSPKRLETRISEIYDELWGHGVRARNRESSYRGRISVALRRRVRAIVPATPQSLSLKASATFWQNLQCPVEG